MFTRSAASGGDERLLRSLPGGPIGVAVVRAAIGSVLAVPSVGAGRLLVAPAVHDLADDLGVGQRVPGAVAVEEGVSKPESLREPHTPARSSEHRQAHSDSRGRLQHREAAARALRSRDAARPAGAAGPLPAHALGRYRALRPLLIAHDHQRQPLATSASANNSRWAPAVGRPSTTGC
jgi:hypothetical protein